MGAAKDRAANRQIVNVASSGALRGIFFHPFTEANDIGLSRALKVSSNSKMPG
jgi:hypothetical protein